MFLKKHLKAAVSTAIVLTLLVAFSPFAYGKVVANTIDPLATVSDSGRRIFVTGPLQTDVVERIYLRVTITQRTTGAMAEGPAILRGTGALQHWEVQARTRGKALFEAGPATAVAVAVAITGERGQTTDAHQWLVNITLETK